MHTVRTKKMFKVQQQAEGNLLYSAYPTITLIRHRCKDKVAVYLGKNVFLTLDNFGSSLLPLRIPRSMAVQKAEVTCAHFSTDVIILFVVDGKIFIYNYKDKTWNQASGVHHTVSHVSGDTCCFKGSSFCLEITNKLFAYFRGDQLANTVVYFSTNGGFSFQILVDERQRHLTGTVEGIFHFHSLSQIGVFTFRNQSAVFIYSDHPLNRSWGQFFEQHEQLDIIQSPGQRGFLIFWNQTSLFVSPNVGQFVDTVQLQEGQTIVLDSLTNNNITIHSIALNENELGVLTREDHLYYGSQGYLRTVVIQLMEQPFWSEDTAIMFESPGMLEVLIPVPDTEFLAFDFRKCTVNIQAVLMDPSLQMKPCNVELLEGPLEKEMYTIDMNSKLDLSAQIIPRPRESPVPLVMVSNPHSLGVQASMVEFGTTFDGNSKYKLEIQLKQQHLLGRADGNFTTISMKRNAISALTVDIADKEISCVDLKPLSTLISIGCDLKKKITVQNKISACAMGILDPVDLQGNYSYIIEKWWNGLMHEIVDAEYVLMEVNGLFTYSYSLTAATAGCKSQPQNWTTVLAATDNSEFKSWDRENYVSCHEWSEDRPLLWPDVQYQILGGRTNNRVIFDQRNGIYVFSLSVVDPHYSYCHLDTVFSVFVYGALPLPLFPPELVILLLTTTMLLSVGLVYTTPKLLATERGHHFKRFWSRLCRGCIWYCSCPWLQRNFQRWLQTRRVKFQREAKQQSEATGQMETERSTDTLQLSGTKRHTDTKGYTDIQEWPQTQTKPRRRSSDHHVPTPP
ncbi:cation channel sperm-associated protein subunit delta isoform X3 [Nannospalax galili]|nr:cation channel sperm-associated protein subunit delta isoform X3 [Nannospalax galili]